LIRLYNKSRPKHTTITANITITASKYNGNPVSSAKIRKALFLLFLVAVAYINECF